jgi:hypothetical protein
MAQLTWLDSAAMVGAIMWRPLLPVGWLGVLLIACLASAIFAYARAPGRFHWGKAALLWLRLLVMAILFAILLGPSREIAPEQETNEGRLMILIDCSQSMDVDDMDGASRLEFAQQRWLSPPQIRQLAEMTQVDLFQFAERPVPVYFRNSQLPDLVVEEQAQTYLVRSVTDVVQSLSAARRNQRILLLSDGIDSEDAGLEPLIAAAQARQVSISCAAFGTPTTTCDIGLVAVAQQDSLYPDELGGLTARIYHSGAQDRRTTLRVQAGQDIQSIPIELSGPNVFEVPVLIRQSEPGTYAYQLSLEALPEETELANNATTVFVPVKPRRIRVLLLEGQPFWDTKFIAETLRKDERIELVQISQIAPGKVETIVTRWEDAAGPTVPRTLEEWSAFDVVILGKDMQRLLDAGSAATLVEHVEQGGGHVIFARGQAADVSNEEGRGIAETLASIEPVVWQGDILPIAKLEATLAGRLTAWLSREAIGADLGQAIDALRPWTQWERVGSIKGAASVIVQAEVEGQWQPAMVVGPAGDGTAVVMAGEGLWRWSLYPPTSPELAGFYDVFWSNLVRALALGSDFEPGQQVALNLSESSVRLGDAVTIDVALKYEVPNGPPLSVVVVAADGQPTDIPLLKLPGRVPRYQAKWTATATGLYEVRLSAPGFQPAELTKNLIVYAMNLELLDTGYRPERLKQLADQTGGQFYDTTAHSQFIRDLKQDLQTQFLPPRIEYFWDQTWIMLLVLVAVGAEWILRRQANLI